MKEVYCNSRDLTKEFDIKHAIIAKLIRDIHNDVLRIGIYKHEFLMEEVPSTYRGQKYISYDMNHHFYKLVYPKLKTDGAKTQTMAYIMGIDACERSIFALRDEKLDLQIEVKNLELYKSVYETYGKIKSTQRGDTGSERMYQSLLIDKFDEYFPDYTLVDQYVDLPDGDQLDILAKDKLSQRDVIIEVKITDKSAHKQLRSYAVHFDKPILVNVSSVKISYTSNKEGIIYVTI